VNIFFETIDDLDFITISRLRKANVLSAIRNSYFSICMSDRAVKST
jgi:hypothetical protein